MIASTSDDFEDMVTPITCVWIEAVRSKAIPGHGEPSTDDAKSLNLRQTVQVDHPVDRCLRVARVEDVFTSL